MFDISADWPVVNVWRISSFSYLNFVIFGVGQSIVDKLIIIDTL